MKFKWIYLFLAFLLPLGISFFIKYFGKSEFNIPVYFKNGVDSIKNDCRYAYSKPYLLNDSIFQGKQSVSSGVWLLSTDTSSMSRKNFQRIETEVGKGTYNFESLKLDANDPFLSCVLFLRKPWTTVLIDNKKQVRGYYAPSTREEADRLIVEMKILLKQY